jgi:hypothetical protein
MKSKPLCETGRGGTNSAGYNLLNFSIIQTVTVEGVPIEKLLITVFL